MLNFHEDFQFVPILNPLLNVNDLVFLSRNLLWINGDAWYLEYIFYVMQGRKRQKKIFFLHHKFLIRSRFDWETFQSIITSCQNVSSLKTFLNEIFFMTIVPYSQWSLDEKRYANIWTRFPNQAPFQSLDKNLWRKKVFRNSLLITRTCIFLPVIWVSQSQKHKVFHNILFIFK